MICIINSISKGLTELFLVFTIGGNGVIRFRDEVYELTTGTIVLVPAHSAVEYYTCKDSIWEFYWINLFGNYAIQSTDYIALEKGFLFRLNRISECLDRIKRLIGLKNDNKLQYELQISGLIFELLQEMIKQLFFEPDGNDSNPYYMKAAAYLEKHYMEQIDLKTLSKMFFISQNQLIRVFQEQFGYTPYEYLKRYRLLKACELLEQTCRPIGEVAHLTGFPNTSNFIHQFKAQYKLTPLGYRKSKAGKIGKKENL